MKIVIIYTVSWTEIMFLAISEGNKSKSEEESAAMKNEVEGLEQTLDALLKEAEDLSVM